MFLCDYHTERNGRELCFRCRPRALSCGIWCEVGCGYQRQYRQPFKGKSAQEKKGRKGLRFLDLHLLFFNHSASFFPLGFIFVLQLLLVKASSCKGLQGRKKPEDKQTNPSLHSSRRSPLRYLLMPTCNSHRQLIAFRTLRRGERAVSQMTVIGRRCALPLARGSRLCRPRASPRPGR